MMMKPLSRWHNREHRTASEELVRCSYTVGTEGKGARWGNSIGFPPPKKKQTLFSLFEVVRVLTTANEANLKSVFIGAVSNILR